MLTAIIRDIIRFWREYIFGGISVAVVCVLCVMLFVKFFKRFFVLSTTMETVFSGKRFVAKLVWIFFIIMYIYIVIGITILSRSESGTQFVSFELFRTFRNTFTARKQIYENIIMFVPYAILLYGLSERFRRLWVALLMGMFSSLLIEVVQWTTHTGYFEVDDILTNTIGMLVGYVLAFLVWKAKEKIRTRRIR